MRLLVTGGAGFIGANFMHNAVREHAVTVLDALTYAGSREWCADADQMGVVEADIADSTWSASWSPTQRRPSSPPKPTSTTRWPIRNRSCTPT